MARKHDLPVWKRWAAASFFLTGVALLLLAVFGPVMWGDAFDGSALQRPALGLIGVAVYVFVGVNLPQIDWASLVARLLRSLAEGERKDGMR